MSKIYKFDSLNCSLNQIISLIGDLKTLFLIHISNGKVLCPYAFNANQKYYDLLSDLRDEGPLDRYGVTQLQMQFGLSDEEAQNIYNQYKEDLEAEQQAAQALKEKNGVDPMDVEGMLKVEVERP